VGRGLVRATLDGALPWPVDEVLDGGAYQQEHDEGAARQRVAPPEGGGEKDGGAQP
jgi:hypothetical protein